MAEEKNSVLVVCTANICRSPMGEALLRHALAAQPEPLRSLQVVSAGVAAYDGDAVTPNSVRALQKVGLDISGHRSKRLTRGHVESAVAVFVMTESHRLAIADRYPDLDVPVYLFREPIPDVEDTSIPDPFGGDLAEYEATRDSMVEAIPAIVKTLSKLTS